MDWDDQELRRQKKFDQNILREIFKEQIKILFRNFYWHTYSHCYV